MILEGVDRKELEALAEAGALVTISASQLLAVIVRFEQLEEKVASLESNSRNSSKPPSSDRHNPNKPKKPRGKKGKRKRKPGGQKGLKRRSPRKSPLRCSMANASKHW